VQSAKVLAFSLLPVVGALLLAEGRRRAPLPLPYEIDLRAPAPLFLELSGFSGAEPWGRWTDADEARVVLPQRLPACVEIELEARAFGPNAGEPVSVLGGASPVSLTFGAELETRRVMLCGLSGRSELVLKVPRPTSPQSLGQGGDTRRLGLGIARLALRALPLAEG
jgi:phosphoglycerol transferase